MVGKKQAARRGEIWNKFRTDHGDQRGANRGFFAVAVGQVPVIWGAVACQAVAFALVAVGVREPRRR